MQVGGARRAATVLPAPAIATFLPARGPVVVIPVVTGRAAATVAGHAVTVELL